jgi:uncharacterized protein (UPF0332 family)
MSVESSFERAEQYLTSADLLLDVQDYASVVSRSFYAMFFVARALLKEEDVTPKTHAGMVNQFGLRFVKSGDVPAEHGRAFRRAQELRELAEYAEEPGVVTEEDARSTLDDARTFVKAMREKMDQA